MSVTKQTFPLVTDERNQDDRIIGALIKRVGLGWPGLALFRKSLRVGSGAATLAALDGGDGRVIADGTQAAIIVRDRADSTKSFVWYESGTVRLNTSQGGDLWLIDPATGVVSPKTAWTAVPTLQNSWVAFGGGHFSPAYSMDILGRVHLRGAIKGGTATPGTLLFTLPAGFAPTASMLFSADSNTAYGSIRVDATGQVLIFAGTNTNLSLNNISFDTRA